MPRDRVGHFYYAWFPTIYQQDTQHLSLAECGAYRRLLDHYMMTRAPLPCADKALARIVGCSVEEWIPISETVKAFFKAKDGMLYQSFCEEQLTKDQRRILRSQENGKKPKSMESKDNNLLGTQPVLPEQTNPEQNIKKQYQTNGEGIGFLLKNGTGFGRYVPSLETSDRLLAIAPGWDHHWLIEQYNTWHEGKERPRNPDAAFLGWAKNFTKGKRPP